MNSKTASAPPEPIRLSIEDARELQARLRLLGNGGRVGPVIVSERERPTASQAAHRRFGRCGMVPPRPQQRDDGHADALTDGGRAGADLLVLGDAAGHLDAATTNRHFRTREANILRLVKMWNDS